MTVPADADKVLGAIRLGWCLAEVRGRNRPDPPPSVDGKMPGGEVDALPLRAERDAIDLRRSAQRTLVALAKNAAVDVDDNGGASFGATIDALAKALAQQQETGSPLAASTWSEFTRLVRRFDAHIQDTLTAASESQACGYQLGRGLAETYWALDATMKEPPTPRAWSFLLGADRCDELTRLLGRLTPYFNEYTSPAISGSLVVWSSVAQTDEWHAQPTTIDDLYAQLRRWYELIVVGQDPTTLVKPFALLKNFKTTRKTIELFLPQLVLGAVFVVALSGFAWLASTGEGSSAGKVFLAALGTVGLSLTTFQAKVKSSAQALMARLRQDAYTDLVAIAITIVPLRADLSPGGKSRLGNPTRRAVTSALNSRRLTTQVGV
jgi:hypothetical protein